MRILFTSVLLLLSFLVYAQSSVGVGFGTGFYNHNGINELIDVYNFTRLWQKNELSKPSLGINGQIVVNRKLNHWLDFTSDLTYQRYSAYQSFDSYSAQLNLEFAQLALGMRLRPLSLNVLDSAGLRNEPFLGAKFFGFANSSRVLQNGLPVQVDDKEFRSFNGNWGFQLNAGYSFQLSKRCYLALQYMYNFMTSTDWDDLTIALHGTNSPAINLKQVSAIHQFGFQLTWKINKALPADDEEAPAKN
jgi:hypothetical protein